MQQTLSREGGEQKRKRPLAYNLVNRSLEGRTVRFQVAPLNDRTRRIIVIGPASRPMSQLHPFAPISAGAASGSCGTTPESAEVRDELPLSAP